jgi:hypothetical protein
MKPIFKLMFVGLLIGAALTLPTRVRAYGNDYDCNSQQFGQCVGSLNQWMGQCAYGCTYDNGGSSQYCFSVPYSDCETIPNSSPPAESCVYATDNECWETSSSGGSCIQGCVNSYTEQYNACLSEYCTQE